MSETPITLAGPNLIILSPQDLLNAALQANLSIGEINPGPNNPGTSPGHNNAIYCEVGQDNGHNSSSNIFFVNGVAIYSAWDAAQNKYKYWMRFIIGTAPPRTKALPTNAKILMVPAQSTNQVYWQVEDETGKDICTVGESIQKAATTNAIVIKQVTNKALPSQ